MKQQLTVAPITDFILQKYKAIISSTGLYEGKAGLSLSLFVASEHLQDERVEDVAYDLIKECLVINQADLSFEKGMAGIGYVLLSLIENKYLDADFDELFSKQYEAIIEGFDTIDQEPAHLMNSLRVIYFLFKVSKIKKDNRAQSIIVKIFEGCELFLTVQFYDFPNIYYSSNKTAILDTFSLYLKLVDYTDYANFSPSLLENYAALYRNGKVVSSLETGYYFKRIAEKNHTKRYDDIIEQNINYGKKNLYPDTLSLKEKIDSAKLMNNKDVTGNSIQDFLEIVDEDQNPLGYAAGLARFLIFKANKDIELL